MTIGNHIIEEYMDTMSIETPPYHNGERYNLGYKCFNPKKNLKTTVEENQVVFNLNSGNTRIFQFESKEIAVEFNNHIQNLLINE